MTNYSPSTNYEFMQWIAPSILCHNNLAAAISWRDNVVDLFVYVVEYQWCIWYTSYSFHSNKARIDYISFNCSLNSTKEYSLLCVGTTDCFIPNSIFDWKCIVFHHFGSKAFGSNPTFGNNNNSCQSMNGIMATNFRFFHRCHPKWYSCLSDSQNMNLSSFHIQSQSFEYLIVYID